MSARVLVENLEAYLYVKCVSVHSSGHTSYDLGRSNCELYLTFRGEGPCSDLTLTQSSPDREASGGEPGRGRWVFVAETSLTQIHSLVCPELGLSRGTLRCQATVTPELHLPTSAHLHGKPPPPFLHMLSDSSNNTQWHYWERIG